MHLPTEESINVLNKFQSSESKDKRCHTHWYETRRCATNIRTHDTWLHTFKISRLSQLNHQRNHDTDIQENYGRCQNTNKRMPTTDQTSHMKTSSQWKKTSQTQCKHSQEYSNHSVSVKQPDHQTQLSPTHRKPIRSGYKHTRVIIERHVSPVKF